MNFINYIHLYYDLRSRQYVDAFNANLPVTSVSVTRGSNVNLHIQAVNNTNGLTINPDYTVSSSYCEDFTNYTNFIFGVKTRYSASLGGPFTQAFVQYDTSDPLYNPTYGSFVIPIGIVNTVPAGTEYVCEYRIMEASGSSAVFGGFAPLEFDLVQNVVIGTEPVTPVVPNNLGVATILSGSSDVVVPFTNMTPTGVVFVSWLGNPYSTLSAIAGTNNFTIQAGGPLSLNTQVAYNVFLTI